MIRIARFFPMIARKIEIGLFCRPFKESIIIDFRDNFQHQYLYIEDTVAGLLWSTMDTDEHSSFAPFVAAIIYP